MGGDVENCTGDGSDENDGGDENVAEVAFAVVTAIIDSDDDEAEEEEERPPPPPNDIMATGVSVADRRVGMPRSLKVDIGRLGFVSCGVQRVRLARRVWLNTYDQVT